VKRGIKMKGLKKNVLKWFDKDRKTAELSLQIWNNPELAMQEEKSSQILCDWLHDEGFQVNKGIAGMPTAFLGTFGSKSPVIAFLAEYDSLPGCSNKVLPRRQPIIERGPGHGCGHNLIGAGNTASAISLKNEMEKLGISGSIRVYGAPAEELLVGKVFMAKQGLFDDCDAVLTSHPAWENAANANANLSLISTEFTFFGQSSHAPLAPESGRNALDAVQLANVAANMRQKNMARGTVIEYVISEGGHQPNMVPDISKVWYFVRHPEVDLVKDSYIRLLDLVRGAAIATGTTWKEQFITGCYGYLPNESLGKLIFDNARIIGAPVFSKQEKQFATMIRKNYGLSEIENPFHEDLRFKKGGLEMDSQDDGDVSWICPLGRINYAFPIGIPFHSWGFTAVSGSSIGQKGMMFSARTLAATAADLLTHPDLLKDIKKEHEKRTKRFRYVSLLPNQTKPITKEFMKLHTKTQC
jgi:aminobenzoyl-glutamate utilization protein B